MTEINDETDETIRCYHCGNPNIVASCDVMPIDDLRELVEAFRSGTFANHDAGKAYEQACNQCADELEAVLDEYE